MGKRTRNAGDKAASVLTARPKADRREARRRARIEKRLAVADRRVARRRAQLEAASARRAALADRLAALAGPDGAPEGGSTGNPSAVQAYCMRERIRVTMRDPMPVTFANGRSAVAGVCSSCGARVVSLKAH
jgi:hypothetical protein